MKKIILFVFTLNSILMNGQFAQAADEPGRKAMPTLTESMQALETLNKELRFADANQKIINFKEAASKIAGGESIYVANVNSPQNYLLIRRGMDVKTSKGMQVSLSVTQVMGRDVVSTTNYNINLGSGVTNLIYKDLFGAKIEDQKTAAGPVELKDGDPVYRTDNVGLYCRIAKDPITGGEVRSVSIDAGAMGFFGILGAGVIALALGHPRFNKSMIPIYGMAAIAATFGLIYIITKSSASNAGC